MALRRSATAVMKRQLKAWREEARRMAEQLSAMLKV